MKQHDRLMKALEEIKTICSKQVDYDIGCGKKCPFLLGREGDNFRGCEVMKFICACETPQEWGEESEE